MTPREFLELVVKPNIREMHEGPSSQRHAMNAVLACDALVAHIYYHFEGPKAAERGDDAYRKLLAAPSAKEAQYYSIVRDLAKALKHVRLHNPSSIPRADLMTVADHEWGKLPWGEFVWRGGKQVVVEIKGKPRSVGASVMHAAKYLERVLCKRECAGSPIT